MRRQYFVFAGEELIGHVSAEDQEAALKSARSLYPRVERLRLEPVVVSQREPKPLELPEQEEAGEPPSKAAQRPRKRRTG